MTAALDGWFENSEFFFPRFMTKHNGITMRKEQPRVVWCCDVYRKISCGKCGLLLYRCLIYIYTVVSERICDMTHDYILLSHGVLAKPETKVRKYPIFWRIIHNTYLIIRRRSGKNFVINSIHLLSGGFILAFNFWFEESV